MMMTGVTTTAMTRTAIKDVGVVVFVLVAAREVVESHGKKTMFET